VSAVPELLYQLALTMVPEIGAVHAKILLEHFAAEEIFRLPTARLEKIDGIGTVRAGQIKAFRDFSRAEQELRFLEKHGIRALPLTHPDYPRRLLHCYDPPTVLFCKGEVNLNAPRVISVVGTRNYTDYGKNRVQDLIGKLTGQQILVVSGLAFGIDFLAHQSALRNGIPTVGIVAHGLQTIYPHQHRGLAKQMLQEGGGLVTQFLSGTKPDKHNFPLRNRIVAGMADATIIVETGIRGGSMITAELANGYNRDVFAVPGRVDDPKSGGCNELIRTNKAILLTGAEQLLETMGWKEKAPRPAIPQRELFLQLTNEEEAVVSALREFQPLHVDELMARSGLSHSAGAAAILQLELQGWIRGGPGNMFELAEAGVVRR